MENTIRGYKAFNADLTNRYGIPFEEGKKYSVNGHAVFGNHGNGFHFCERLEDTLRYSDALKEDVIITKVTALGNVIEFSDEYYGYFDLYVTDKIRIDKTRRDAYELGGSFLACADADVSGVRGTYGRYGDHLVCRRRSGCADCQPVPRSNVAADHAVCGGIYAAAGKFASDCEKVFYP